MDPKTHCFGLLADADLCCVDPRTIIFFLGRDRWTLGFYAGRIIWLITSLVVLILLLLEITKLYAFCARSYGLLERERNNKLLNAQAITAAIAHEVRQPLTAIIASGGAALRYLEKTPPENERARLALSRIIKEGHRTPATCLMASMPCLREAIKNGSR